MRYSNRFPTLSITIPINKQSGNMPSHKRILLARYLLYYHFFINYSNCLPLKCGIISGKTKRTLVLQVTPPNKLLTLIDRHGENFIFRPSVVSNLFGTCVVFLIFARIAGYNSCYVLQSVGCSKLNNTVYVYRAKAQLILKVTNKLLLNSILMMIKKYKKRWLLNVNQNIKLHSYYNATQPLRPLARFAKPHFHLYDRISN